MAPRFASVVLGLLIAACSYSFGTIFTGYKEHQLQEFLKLRTNKQMNSSVTAEYRVILKCNVAVSTNENRKLGQSSLIFSEAIISI